MSTNGSEIFAFTDTILLAYLSVIARTVRHLDKEHGPGSTDLFREALERSMEAEIRQLQPGEADIALLSAFQKALLRLVEDMPPELDL